MTSILATQVTDLLTTTLGRAPTAAELADGLISPWTLAQVHNDLNVVGSNLAIDSTQNVQAAINSLNSNGGGVLTLLPGTYSLAANLTLYTGISLVGTSPASTFLNFGSTNHAIVAAGTNVYTTGTIATITSGVNVTGSGTAWLTNVTAGQSLFLGTQWYLIAAVTSNTTLILTEGFNGSVTLPASYRIASIITDVELSNLTVLASTGNGLTFTDVRRLTMMNCLFVLNNVGVAITNVSEWSADRVTSGSNASHGITITNGGNLGWSRVNCAGNGGSGLVLSNILNMDLTAGGYDSNAVDGINITSGMNISLLVDASSNGGKGINAVATNTTLQVYNSRIVGNASDGIKLTATSDNCKLYANDIEGNGAYGINVAASTCDNNIISLSTFASNTTAAAHDSGTGTLIRSNIGLADN